MNTEHTLSYRCHVRKGQQHINDGVLYVHHFGTGFQELVFRDHAEAARFATTLHATLHAPTKQEEKYDE